MLPFPLFNHTIFQGVREIPGVLYLAAQEGFTKVQHAQFPVSLFDQKIPFKTLERCINHTRVKPACSDQAFMRNGGFLHKEVIDCPVRILFFHLYSFLMGVNKGFVLLLKKKCVFMSFFLCLRNQ
jgi:hypothetical protein